MSFEDRIRLPALSLIHRRLRLLTYLDELVEANNRLVTVYAPGGYGKSILLADFAQTTDLPVCWCSLEQPDRDPTSFLTLLSYSIIDRFHEIDGDALLQLVKRGDTQNSIRPIADALATVGPHIIIIDDYHKAVSAGMTLALNRLLEQLPETSTIIVAARGDMALETGQIIDLLIAERATGLSEEELRFTAKEIQRVMRKRFGRSIELDNAEQIAKATDGNIAQILLTGHVMHSEQLIGRLAQGLGGDREIIYNYLAEEVFEKQAPALQKFLLCTSILPDMTAELCNALLEIDEAQQHIEELVRNDLFIAQKGAGFRYHDLFAEFLQIKLAEDSTLHQQIKLRAAKLLSAQSRFEEAIDLLLSIKAWDEAATLLETQGKYFYDTGRALTLNSWLEEISENEMDQFPRLLLMRGQILTSDLGQPEQALNYFQRAEQLFRTRKDEIGVAETQVWRSYALRMMGQATESLRLAQTGLEQLEALGADDRLIAWAIRRRGIAYWAVGNIEDSLTDLRRALELFEGLGDSYNVGLCHHEIGVALVAQGNLSGADHHYRQALHIWEVLGNAIELANTLNSLGVSLLVTQRYDEAFHRFNEGLEIALQIGALRRAAFIQTGIGDVHLECQDYKRALKAFESSTNFAQQASVRSLEVYNLVKMGECFYQQQDLMQSLALATQAREIATEVGLGFERGLAILLQAKIYVHRTEYAASFELFAEATACLAESDILERIKVRLWWGYSLLLNLRTSAAIEQLQAAVRLVLGVGELRYGLQSTIVETQPLLRYFLHWPDTPSGLRDSIELLLSQGKTQVEISRSSLQVFAFGTPYLIVNGRLRYFTQRGGMAPKKAPEFLLYLLLNGQDGGCRWDEVSAILWPELAREKASNNFHQTLKRLRDVVFEDPDYILVQDDYYQVNPQYLEWCDALAFEKLFERINSTTTGDKLALQLELIALYQGEVLAGFDLSDWGAEYRYGCELRFLQTVKLAGEQLLRQQEPQQVLNILEKGLAQDQFREDLHRDAFRAYAQLGLYDHLASYYSQLCQLFENELDTQPDPTTTKLYEKLMREK